MLISIWWSLFWNSYLYYIVFGDKNTWFLRHWNTLIRYRHYHQQDPFSYLSINCKENEIVYPQQHHTNNCGWHSEAQETGTKLQSYLLFLVWLWKSKSLNDLRVFTLENRSTRLMKCKLIYLANFLLEKWNASSDWTINSSTKDPSLENGKWWMFIHQIYDLEFLQKSSAIS